MAEMVHRIAPSRIFFPDQQKYLLVTTGDDTSGSGFETLDRSYRDVLEFLEIGPSQVTVLNENTVVERLSISEQGANFGGHPAPEYLDVLAEASKRRLDELHGTGPSARKVYVSKSKIPHGGTILGESYLEGLLRDEGFLVFYPEETPLSAQMDIYRKASELVFCEGSACHGTELLGTRMLDRVFVLGRRPETRGALSAILGPRSHQFELFRDTVLLGTAIVHGETRRVHTEFSVSLVDIDRFVAFFREHKLARLDEIDASEYFEAAERDLRAYFSYHMKADIGEVDPWRIGELRLEFEKFRRLALSGRQSVADDLPREAATEASAGQIEERAWTAHNCKRWLEAADRWSVYRERFPSSAEGFTLGSVALIELGRFYEADALLRQAMEKFPGFSEAYSNYALVAHHRRDWREAAARWATFRARFPLSMMGYSLGATALGEIGKHAEADALLRQGLEFVPNDEELLEKHAWVAQFLEDRQEAQLRWERLRAEYPHNRAASKYLQELSV